MGNLFVVDTYHGNWNDGPAPWRALAREGKPRGLVGAIVKAGDGDNPHRWFRTAAPAASHELAHVGAYWWVRSQVGSPDGIRQGKLFADQWKRAGLGASAIHPMLDVEHEPGAHDPARTARIVAECAETVRQALGRPVGLYAKSILMDSATDALHGLLGCDFNWTAGYSARISKRLAENGIPREKVLLWQFTNGTDNDTTFPTVISPTWGRSDMSVFLGRSLAESTSYDAFRRLLTASAPGAGAAIGAATALALAFVGLGR